ncbi:MAG: ATP-binding protein [Actinomycetota bacterium]|nr:ATP-binding protein [Actinomycetota bacterium]
MEDKNETGTTERLIARVTVTADVDFLPVVVDFVRRTAHRLGLRDEAADHLDRAVELVCRNVAENAFESDQDGSYDVYVLRRPVQIVVAVEDRGLPDVYARFERGEDSGLRGMLQHSFADEAHFINLGRGGNRVELIKNLPHADVRDHLSEEEHRKTVEAAAASVDVPLEVRMMRPEETIALSRGVYRSYGYSYDWDDIYYPERIRELQESGLMRSCVVVSTGNEIVGHLAVMVEHPESPVGEAGQAVVDPRFRGHRLFERMKIFLAEEARKAGMYGLYSEATAVHPYSQKGNLHLGAKETGYLLGYIPASVSYKQIGEERADRRGSIALMYLRVNEERQRDIYPPPSYRDVVGRIVEYNGLQRTVVEDPGSDVRMGVASSRMSVNVRRDHNVAFLRIAEPGSDLREIIRLRLRELCLHRVDCIYADLPLSHPATGDAGELLGDLGFFFGCIVPEAGEGDILRLQYLNNVEIEPDDVHTASEFGGELLDLIFRQKNE